MVQACHPSTQSVEVTRRVRILRSSLGPETHKTFSLNNQLEWHQHLTAIWTRCHSSCPGYHPSLHRTNIQYTYPGLSPIIQTTNMYETPTEQGQADRLSVGSVSMKYEWAPPTKGHALTIHLFCKPIRSYSRPFNIQYTRAPLPAASKSVLNERCNCTFPLLRKTDYL